MGEQVSAAKKLAEHRERPILFSAPMVRALLEGRKTQTRRIVKPQPEPIPEGVWREKGSPGVFWPSNRARQMLEPREMPAVCPYGAPGDRLWVKETIRLDWTEPNRDWGGERAGASYVADGAPTKLDAWPWKRNQLNSIHCPRGLSRITLTIASVRVERLNDISATDARAEGMTQGYQDDGIEDSYEGRFRTLWESINGDGSWSTNPWVWVIDFGKAAVSP